MLRDRAEQAKVCACRSHLRDSYGCNSFYRESVSILRRPWLGFVRPQALSILASAFAASAGPSCFLGGSGAAGGVFGPGGFPRHFRPGCGRTAAAPSFGLTEKRLTGAAVARPRYRTRPPAIYFAGGRTGANEVSGSMAIGVLGGLICATALNLLFPAVVAKHFSRARSRGDPTLSHAD
jgi:hypothetical protein